MRDAMDVVGGVIVAAQTGSKGSVVAAGVEDRRMAGVKRGHCGGEYDVGAAGAGLMEMGLAWGEPEPWNFHRRVKAGEVSGAPDCEHRHQQHRDDYELRSVWSSGTNSPPRSAASAMMLHAAGRLVRWSTIPGVTNLENDTTRALLAPFYRPTDSLIQAHSWIEPLTFLLKKELTLTDVGELGRIILPKRDAECQLPHLDSKEGKLLNMEDYNSNKHWTLRYKWWPNNKSRMYVLENTGEFVKYYDLKEKDELILYKDGIGNLVIRGQKWSSSLLRAESSFKGKSATTTTGKRSLTTGRRSLKAGSPTNATCSNSTSALSMSVLSSSAGLTTTTTTGSVLDEHQMASSTIVGTLGPMVDGGAIDWEKLQDPPAIEFSDPPAIEFPGEFECAWADCI